MCMSPFWTGRPRAPLPPPGVMSLSSAIASFAAGARPPLLPPEPTTCQICRFKADSVPALIDHVMRAHHKHGINNNTAGTDFLQLMRMRREADLLGMEMDDDVSSDASPIPTKRRRSSEEEEERDYEKKENHLSTSPSRMHSKYDEKTTSLPVKSELKREPEENSKTPEVKAMSPLDLTGQPEPEEEEAWSEEKVGQSAAPLAGVGDERSNSDESEANSRANSPPLRKRSRKGNPLKLDTAQRSQGELYDVTSSDVTNAAAAQCESAPSDVESEKAEESRVGAIDSAPMFSSRVDRRKLLERPTTAEHLSPRSAPEVDGTTAPEVNEEQRSFTCQHCDISFADCVMFTIHSGYHGFRDPFECNLCGEKTKNKMEFFLHLTRAAHH